MGSRDDFSDQLIGVLGAGSVEARITAAMGARRFSLDRFRVPLLDRVRQDPSWLVRYHAAESLFALADIYPREARGHPALMAAVAGKSSKNESLLEGLGFPAPLTAEERARLAGAADQLDAESGSGSRRASARSRWPRRGSISTSSRSATRTS